ncbi:putative histone-lysine N-methyltransferase chromatin remodeling SET family [Medicago truncatula]|uniref:Histone-lysine N-methyltransferase, suvh protein, putative n=1 Tax=Medicago truncatula TaxID=3880 RepID=A0A072TTY0_MEDTR|nr:histone-lysine N-methyltransferase family member SUVH9 [Medicago truncatula]KEH20298.1 histone-lysine N-methyltransferase, suvh protein, putative [Medicago truncatula]RHN41743.1 putative histone-lysine N-methyltransferase chromatin remodeling SET family [Medicago truncatula]
MHPFSLTLETPSSSSSSSSSSISQPSSHVPIPTITPDLSISHQIPKISTLNHTTLTPPPITTISTRTSLQTSLVPNLEPFNNFFASQDSQQQPNFSPESETDDQLDLYTKFYHTSKFYPFLEIVDSNNDFVVSLENTVNVCNQNLNLNLNLGVDSVNDGNDRAIFVVPEQQESSLMVDMVREKESQVMELVRFLDLSTKDQMHFHHEIRRKRMIYDSLRVLVSIEEEKRMNEEKKLDAEVAVVEAEMRVGEENRVVATRVEGETINGIRRRSRNQIHGYMTAATLMKECGLWLYHDQRIVGPIPGIYVGDVFMFRMELCVTGLHMHPQAGIDYLSNSISYNGEPIATSVIVSGGYEDDMELDDGDVIIYTGHGGREKNSSRQICDQKLEGGNLALERSMHYGIEVRVIRGMKYEGSASTSGKVYVYDGLYKIVSCRFDLGKSGFGVYKYKLLRIEGQVKMGSTILKDARDIKKIELDFMPMSCLSIDISNNRENVPIRLFNDIDVNQEPLYYMYLPNTTFPWFVFHQSGEANGCGCKEACTDGCFCAMKNGGEFPYNLHGLLVKGKPLIFECGPFCSCPPNCRNRVAQKGLKYSLEVFRSTQTGWGVRSLDLIQAGSFICEYTGVAMTSEQAQTLTMNEDSLVYPSRFANRWVEWGDLSQIYTKYVRPSYPPIPPLDYFLDVSTMRNVASYMSHSSSPNIFIQYVLYDHNNLLFPHVMLYAMENIPPMRELCIDYGISDEWANKMSICM